MGDFILKLKNNTILKIVVIGILLGIIIFSAVSSFMGEKKMKNPHVKNIENVVPKDIVKNINENDIDFLKPTYNKERLNEELEEEFKKKKDINETYLPKIYDIGDNIIKNKEYAKTKKLQNDEKKVNDEVINEEDEIEDLENIKPIQEIDIEPERVEVNRYNKEKIQKEVELYSQLLSLSDNEVGDSWFNVTNEDDKRESIEQYNQNDKNVTIISGNNKIKVIPGSSFLGTLMIDMSNVYSEYIDPLIRIDDGPLKDYVLVCKTQENKKGDQLVFTCDRLVDPLGNEINIHAVAVSLKDLTPQFVDRYKSNLIPRIALATLGSIVDFIYEREITKDKETYTEEQSEGEQPGSKTKTMLSAELEREIAKLQPEIYVDRQKLAVVFY